MTHVFLVNEALTLAYCGCGGWVLIDPKLRGDKLDRFASLSDSWRTLHWLPDVLQPGKDTTVGDSNAES